MFPRSYVERHLPVVIKISGKEVNEYIPDRYGNITHSDFCKYCGHDFRSDVAEQRRHRYKVPEYAYYREDAGTIYDGNYCNECVEILRNKYKIEKRGDYWYSSVVQRYEEEVALGKRIPPYLAIKNSITVDDAKKLLEKKGYVVVKAPTGRKQAASKGRKV